MNKIILNGKEISLEEFQIKKIEFQNKKGIQLVEISPGNWRSRLLG